MGHGTLVYKDLNGEGGSLTAKGKRRPIEESRRVLSKREEEAHGRGEGLLEVTGRVG